MFGHFLLYRLDGMERQHRAEEFSRHLAQTFTVRVESTFFFSYWFVSFLFLCRTFRLLLHMIRSCKRCHIPKSSPQIERGKHRLINVNQTHFPKIHASPYHPLIPVQLCKTRHAKSANTGWWCPGYHSVREKERSNHSGMSSLCSFGSNSRPKSKQESPAKNPFYDP